MTNPRAIDYTTADFHYSFKIGIHDFCICDKCRGVFKHYIYQCKALTWKDGKWFCRNCKGVGE